MSKTRGVVSWEGALCPAVGRTQHCLLHIVTHALQRIQYDAKAFVHRRLKGIHLALKRITSCANGTTCVLRKMPSRSTEGGTRYSTLPGQPSKWQRIHGIRGRIN